jgi:hypothetical protein
VSRRRTVAVLGAVALCASLLTSCSGTHASMGRPAATVPARSAPRSSGTAPSTAAAGLSAFYGVNFDLAGFATFAHGEVAPLIGALDPSTVRWPGGTEADFYDWHSGKDTERANAVPFTLSELANVCQATGAVPIFDLNVLAEANRTDPTDQIAMLQAAQGLGLPVKYVEIGNELYSDAPGVPQAFPDGSAYARTVSIYVQALHRTFPGVQVAADAIPFPEDQREQSWDRQVLAGTAGAGAPDAWVVHFYPGLYQNPFTSADAPVLFASVYAAIEELRQAVASLGGKPVWLTEYNMRGPYQLFRRAGESPSEGDFAHELYLAAFASMLPNVPDLTLADNWTALADGFYGAWQDPAAPYLTPGGQAVEMVDAAGRGGVSAAPVSVPGAPKLPGGEPGVVGEQFVRPGATSSAVVTNLTGQAVAVALSTGSWLGAGRRYQQVAGDPTAPEMVAAAPTTGVIGAEGLMLPPYSVTVVGATLAAR